MRTLILLSLVGLPLTAWGPKGHRLAADASLRALPPELRAWYSGREAAYREAAQEPDLQKAEDPEENSRHHIYTEAYGGPARIPFEAEAATRRLGAFSFARRGQLPWAIGERYGRLMEAFRAKDRERVIFESGWLCHYASDAQVPLHSTRNHNGKETGQRGIHKRWEVSLVEWKVETLAPPRAAQVPANPIREPWGWIAEAHGLLPGLLEADERATRDSRDTGIGDPGDSPYWPTFWGLQKGSLVHQLQCSAERSGDLLLAAWNQAGRPSVSPPPDKQD
jgi:hypothetical protein